MYSLIPSILPFMILSNYIVYSNMSRYISKIIHPVFSKIFHTSENGSYVVFMGFLCGFPLGSKILFDLLKKRKISASEANSLFKYINNPSPSFIICYMSSFYFENFQSKLILLLMMYAPSLIIGIFNFHSADNSFQSSAVSQVFSFTKVLDESIFQALQTLVKLSEYPVLENALLHSDRGVLYLTDEFQKKVLDLKMDQSMSRLGNCWDNAPQESYFALFKTESGYENCTSFDELEDIANRYRKYFNEERPKWDRMQMTPNEYEEYLNGLSDEEFAEYLAKEEKTYQEKRKEAREKAIEKAKRESGQLSPEKNSS